MRRASLPARLCLQNVLLVVAVCVGADVLLGSRARTAALARSEEALRAEVALAWEAVRREMARPEGGDVPRLLQELSHAGTRFALLDAAGVLRAGATPDPPLAADRISAALRQSSPVSWARRQPTSPAVELVALLATGAAGVGKGGAGLLAATRDVQPALVDATAGVDGAVATAGSAGVVLAILLGLWTGMRRSRELDALTRALDADRAGDRPPALPAATTRETEALATAVGRSIGERRRRLAEMAAEQAKLGAILGGMTEGVVAIDDEERVLHMNGTAAALLRTHVDDVIGRPIWEVTRVRQVSEALARTLREGAEHTDEAVLPGRPEDQVLELRCSPMLDFQSGVAGAVVVVHDVTRLRRLEVMRRDFVANVSHELKTPLTAIRGLVETLVDDRDMDEDTRRRFLGKMQRQVQRLSALVADLLTLSRVESGKAAYERALVDARNPVRESVRALLGEARTKGLDLQVELSMEPAMVLGDTEALRQVVDNLVSNAIKYTPERGCVAIRLLQDGAAATIEVRDTGIGIAPRDQERIFERFYRVDKARSREVGGTGLGLAIVKHVVQALGGQVGVESTLGRGSTFRVTFPLAKRSVDHDAPS